MKLFQFLSLLGLSLLSSLLLVQTSEAVIHSYYIGVDKLPTFSSGTYAGQTNPNYQRLTFLLAHQYPTVPANPGDLDSTVNHFHSVGSYRLTGPASAPTTIFGNARIPEGARPAIPLQAGSGAFDNKLVSAFLGDETIGLYTNLTIAPLSQLRSYHENGILNEPEDYMYFGYENPNPALATAASNQRYSTTNLTGSDVHLRLVSLTSGLHIANAAGTSLFFGLGDELHLGDGDTFGLFTPYFWTDASALPGVYSAKFMLTDENALFGDSGEFQIDFVVVPEPSTGAAMAVAAVATCLRRRRMKEVSA